MIKTIKGDVFANLDPERDTVIAHGCNTEGVMGAGIALYIYIKTKYPKAYEDYKRHHTLYGLNLCGGDPEVLMEIFEFAFRVVDASLYIKD